MQLTNPYRVLKQLVTEDFELDYMNGNISKQQFHKLAKKQVKKLNQKLIIGGLITAGLTAMAVGKAVSCLHKNNR